MIPENFYSDGYAIIPSKFSNGQIKALRTEAQRLQDEEKRSSIRNLRQKSDLIRDLRFSEFMPSPDYCHVRSILFDKTTKDNWPVAWHQDLTIAVKDQKNIEGFGPWSLKDGTHHVQPPVRLLEEMITLRVHLDETSKVNGALQVIPGSHRLGKIPSDLVHHHTKDQAQTCHCHPGDLLLMSPLILHASSRSQTSNHRRILHFEFAPGSVLPSQLEWLEE